MYFLSWIKQRQKSDKSVTIARPFNQRYTVSLGLDQSNYTCKSLINYETKKYFLIEKSGMVLILQSYNRATMDSSRFDD